MRSLLAKHARPLRPNEHNSAIVGSGEALSGTGTTKATASLPELEPPPYRQQFFGCPVLDEKAYRELWAWAEGLGADLGGVRLVFYCQMFHLLVLICLGDCLLRTPFEECWTHSLFFFLILLK